MNFHHKTLLTFGAVLLLSTAVFTWMVILDKGTITVTSVAPYSISAEGDSLKVPKTKDCEKDVCDFKLPTGAYDLTFRKSGHENTSYSVAIARGETSTVTIDFDYIPTVEDAGNYEEYINIFEPEDMSDHFSFEMDEEYNKQRLIYTDPVDGGTLIWTYFDRELIDPVVFAHPDLTHILAVDRAKAPHELYWIGGEPPSRSYIDELADVHAIIWSDDPYHFVLQTLTTRSGEVGLWVVDVDTRSVVEWPFEFDLDKLVFNGEGNLIFATDQNLDAITEIPYETTVDALKALLNGDFMEDNSVAFVVGEYDVANQSYSVLYEVPTSLKMEYPLISLIYDEPTDRVLFTDTFKVYEVIRGE
jgi:hypothetical protein